MKNCYKYFTVLIVALVFLLPFDNIFGAEATIDEFIVNPSTIPANTDSTLSFSFKISSTEQDIINQCGGFFGPGNFLYWEIQRANVISELRLIKNGTIPASDFLLGGPIQRTGSFQINPENKTSESFQLFVGCGSSDSGVTRQFTSSTPVTITVTGQAFGIVEITNFNVTPRSATPGSNTNFQFTLDIRSSTQSINNNCDDRKIVWRVHKFPASRGDNFSLSNQVKSGAISGDQFGGSSSTINQDFNQAVTALNEDFVFKTRVTCQGALGEKQLTVSSPVSISSGGGGTVCNNNGTCDAGETSANCSDCPITPGETQSYSFDIPNPLQGGVTDFAGLVRIIAQWIFNLAIPIAVAMIVYAGILFLTAAGEPAKITKAKDVLKWAVVGLAIILIGSGFVTLIQSVLELGSDSNLPSPTDIEPTYGPPAPGAIGNRCNQDRDCLSVLECKNTICQRPTGNLVGEPCNSGTNCDVGLNCDRSNPQPPIDGQDLGLCVQTVGTGGQLGDPCQRDNQCVSGLKCNQICQRNGGNLNGEVCLSTSNPSNCQSRACHTVSGTIRGDCVPYSGT